jgi:hypothetical protein
LIRQRIRPVGEAVITKRKITENKKILLSTKSEKIIIRYPDGTETDITSRNTVSRFSLVKLHQIITRLDNLENEVKSLKEKLNTS